LEYFKNDKVYNLILLDVMIPDIDGFEVLKSIRLVDQKVPVLMLTARADDHDRLKGLGLGADDYITKPFHLQELLLRVKRMLQRMDMFKAAHSETGPIVSGPFTLDILGLKLICPNGTYQLTALESDVLKEFLSQPAKVLSREYLLETVWGLKGGITTRTVDNFIVRLRKFLEEDPSKPQYLKSIRGKGYRFVENGKAEEITLES
jgi:DNA-binding response OmpR family regulator